MNAEDNKLIEEYLAGDTASFEKLVQKYLKPVYNFLFHLISDKAILDDLTQETFVKAWKNLERFDRSKNFKTWIFTIARNTAWDYLKKKKAIPFSAFEDEEGNNKLEQISDNAILPDEILMDAESKINLGEKLQELPAHYRALLLLHYKDELSLQEISVILKKPYNTVKSQHARALASLKKILFLSC
jgi:RNA polymerase sigma-70 factor (ECF subfamily)